MFAAGRGESIREFICGTIPPALIQTQTSLGEQCRIVFAAAGRRRGLVPRSGENLHISTRRFYRTRSARYREAVCFGALLRS